MDRFESMMQTIANDNTVPEQVWAKYTDTLRNLPEKKMTDTAFVYAGTARKTKPLRHLKYAAVLAASLCLVAGTAYAATRSGLTDYLSGFIGQSDVEDGLLGEPDEVTVQQEQIGSYGDLWKITDTWYDGAKVYFYAETPESILEDGKLKVTYKDHMTVNGVDHLLNSEEQSDGTYLCWVDVSDLEDTETLELSVRLKLLQNQYDWAGYDLTTDNESGYDYATDVTVLEEQTLTFTIEGESVVRKGTLETVDLEQAEGIEAEGDVKITEATLSPSTLTLHFTYRLSGEDAEELLNLPTMRGALFYIEDESGNQISTSSGSLATLISEAYTDEDGKLCLDFELSGSPGTWVEGQPSLDTETSSLTIIPYEADWDEEGKLMPDTDRELGWGSFTVSFE
ncbi:MAG: hypothetical protein LUI39_01680 [Lachnospiraceae bacterium]|nr:hypothetical protein [Lachnospiraceae bacterium]